MLGVALQRRNDQILVAILCMLFLLLFMGTRYYVGCDYTGYLNRYEETSIHTPLTGAFALPEWGFELIVIGVVTSGLDFVWVNIVSSAIMLCCWFYFIRQFPNPLMILALLFPVIIMQLGMSGLRQALSVSFVMVASISFINQKRLATAFWILFAAQFHSSAYILLPLAALAGARISFGRLTWTAVALLPIALFLLGDRIDTYQDRYIEQIYGDQSSGGAVFRYFLVLIPTVLFFLNLQKMEEAFPRYHGLLTIFNLATISAAPLIFLSTFALHRFSFYLMPFSIVTFICVIRVMFKPEDLRLGLLLPPAVYAVYAIGWQTLSGHYQSCYVPYQSVLFLS